MTENASRIKKNPRMIPKIEKAVVPMMLDDGASVASGGPLGQISSGTM